jgi:hypothetical protein
MGRPTKLTATVQATIVKEIALGVTLDDAAMAAGVSYTTLQNWRNRGAAAKSGQYFEFLAAVSLAEAEAAANFTKTLTSAAQKGDWKAALEWLKRRRRGTWGDAMDLNMSGKVTVIRVVDETHDRSDDSTPEAAPNASGGASEDKAI